MAAPSRPIERLALRLLTPLDTACNRLYGWRGNPLYHSGAIVVALLLVLIVTGLWLIFFYRVGAPHASVARITADPWLGNWIRSVHRYASDAAVIAAAVHAFRMFAQGRSWGARALAWMSGVVLAFLFYVVGLTGFVMVWDTFGHQVALEGARMLDSLPILSEPISRAFTGEASLLGAFFFLNLFAHIAIPLGIALVLWLHVSRVARPALMPPRRLSIALVVALIAVSVLWPLGMQPEANPFALPADVELDVIYGFWMLAARKLPAGVALGGTVATGLALFLLPLAMKRRGSAAPPPSVVDEDKCTGCRQCSIDCPYEAIEMIERPGGGRSLEMARVDPDLCVSCGICAGSCAPMAVGPAGRTGRDQLVRVREHLATDRIGGRVVVVCCGHSAHGWSSALAAEGADIYPVDCAGSVHTSVIEFLVRGGAAGVLVLSCPPRDCRNREGPKWLVERMYEDREAELQARVDRRRVRVAHASAGERGEALAALRGFMADTRKLGQAAADPVVNLEVECVVDTVEKAK